MLRADTHAGMNLVRQCQRRAEGGRGPFRGRHQRGWPFICDPSAFDRDRAPASVGDAEGEDLIGDYHHSHLDADRGCSISLHSLRSLCPGGFHRVHKQQTRAAEVSKRCNIDPDAERQGVGGPKREHGGEHESPQLGTGNQISSDPVYSPIGLARERYGRRKA